MGWGGGYKEQGGHGLEMKQESDLGEAPVLVAFWDEHGLLWPVGLLQGLAPLHTALGLTAVWSGTGENGLERSLH